MSKVILCMYTNVWKYFTKKKQFVPDEVRLQRLETYREQYWSDEQYRLEKSKIEQRSKTRVVCGRCKKDFVYGSMLAHRKVCKGFKEPNMLEILVSLL
jgi:hypothetical protein